MRTKSFLPLNASKNVFAKRTMTVPCKSIRIRPLGHPVVSVTELTEQSRKSWFQDKEVTARLVLAELVVYGLNGYTFCGKIERPRSAISVETTLNRN